MFCIPWAKDLTEGINDYGYGECIKSDSDVGAKSRSGTELINDTVKGDDDGHKAVMLDPSYNEVSIVILECDGHTWCAVTLLDTIE